MENLSKKIAIIGAQNCGKTTSLYYLSYKLKRLGRNLGIGHEVARDCPYPLNEAGGILSQLWIIFKQIEREAKLESYYDKVIFDRSVFDSVAYCDYLVTKRIVESKDAKFARDTAFAWAKNHPYTLLVYLKPLRREKDPIRGANTGLYQRAIERNFAELLGKLPCKVIRVDIAPKEKRCREVYRIVREELYGR